jgi:hypothetical protein
MSNSVPNERNADTINVSGGSKCFFLAHENASRNEVNWVGETITTAVYKLTNTAFLSTFNPSETAAWRLENLTQVSCSSQPLNSNRGSTLNQHMTALFQIQITTHLSLSFNTM